MKDAGGGGYVECQYIGITGVGSAAQANGRMARSWLG